MLTPLFCHNQREQQREGEALLKLYDARAAQQSRTRELSLMRDKLHGLKRDSTSYNSLLAELQVRQTLFVYKDGICSRYMKLKRVYQLVRANFWLIM